MLTLRLGAASGLGRTLHARRRAVTVLAGKGFGSKQDSPKRPVEVCRVALTVYVALQERCRNMRPPPPPLPPPPPAW